MGGRGFGGRGEGGGEAGDAQHVAVPGGGRGVVEGAEELGELRVGVVLLLGCFEELQNVRVALLQELEGVEQALVVGFR